VNSQSGNQPNWTRKIKIEFQKNKKSGIPECGIMNLAAFPEMWDENFGIPLYKFMIKKS
jgi:hypothetical protein